MNRSIKRKSRKNTPRKTPRRSKRRTPRRTRRSFIRDNKNQRVNIRKRRKIRTRKIRKKGKSSSLECSVCGKSLQDSDYIGRRTFYEGDKKFCDTCYIPKKLLELDDTSSAGDVVEKKLDFLRETYKKCYSNPPARGSSTTRRGTTSEAELEPPIDFETAEYVGHLLRDIRRGLKKSKSSKNLLKYGGRGGGGYLKEGKYSKGGKYSGGGAKDESHNSERSRGRSPGRSPDRSQSGSRSRSRSRSRLVEAVSRSHSKESSNL